HPLLQPVPPLGNRLPMPDDVLVVGQQEVRGQSAAVAEQGLLQDVVELTDVLRINTLQVVAADQALELLEPHDIEQAQHLLVQHQPIVEREPRCLLSLGSSACLYQPRHPVQPIHATTQLESRIASATSSIRFTKSDRTLLLRLFPIAWNCL